MLDIHCDKSIWRPGKLPCNSWEHYQIQLGNIFLAQIPAIARFLPIYSWELSQLCFPAIAGIFPRFNLGIVPVSAWELSQLYMMYRREPLLSKRQKQRKLCNLIVKWLGCLLAKSEGMGSILTHSSLNSHIPNYNRQLSEVQLNNH